MTRETLMARVRTGAAWLDTKRPGWFSEIRLDNLAMESEHRCVLGQCYGSYKRAPGVQSTFNFSFAGKPQFAAITNVEFSHSHGFYVGDMPAFFSPKEPWHLLTDCWTTVILERRFAVFDQQCRRAREAVTA